MGGIPNKRRTPEGAVPDYTSTKIDENLIKRAKIIAAHRGVSISDYVSDTLESCIDRDYEAMNAQIAREIEEKKRKPGKPPGGKPPGGKDNGHDNGDDDGGPSGPVARFSDDQGIVPARPGRDRRRGDGPKPRKGLGEGV